MTRWRRSPTALGVDLEAIAPPRRRTAPRPTRCSAIAAAGWGSPTRRSTRCRRARSSRARSTWRRRPARRRMPEIMIPLVGMQEGAGDHPRAGRQGRRGGVRRGRHDDRIQRRHDDRAAARGADRRQDRRDRRLLQLRHQRPDADRVRPVARRRRQVPAALRRAGILPKDPFVSHRRRGRRRDGAHRRPSAGAATKNRR